MAQEKVIVIGAGAAGTMAALTAADRGARVVLIDGNEKLGRKLYATGNGRCNFTNTGCSPADYNGAGDGFTEAVLDQFTPGDCIRFFETEGLLTREETEGRCYPYSGRAAGLVEVLERACRRRDIELLLGDRALDVSLAGTPAGASPARTPGGMPAEQPESCVISAGKAGVRSGGASPARTLGGMPAGARTSTDVEPAGASPAGCASLAGTPGGNAGADVQAGSGADSGVTGPKFRVRCESGRIVAGDALIIACGGRAGLQFGSTGDGYGFARTFGHTLAETRPALTAVECAGVSGAGGTPDQKLMERLRGVRARGRVTLICDGKETASESGEIQFTGTGISGICVYDLTRFMDAPRPAKPGKKKKNRSGRFPEPEKHDYVISVDLLPELTEDELTDLAEHFSATAGTLSEGLSGILDRKLAEVVAEICGDDQREAAHVMKRLSFSVTCTKGWEESQVTRGGVNRSEIAPETMESKLVDGLYFCGEVVDVDGRCGGYNLQWAWASGRVAGSLKSRSKRDAE
ncbi:MAG: aminoacetone oxidase family FAD-binding enzyme [Clostridia bacterium]|nr:aminoacetone oxidase family FAD-binding enzyme [Clostridia bacterium]